MYNIEGTITEVQSDYAYAETTHGQIFFWRSNANEFEKLQPGMTVLCSLDLKREYAGRFEAFCVRRKRSSDATANFL